MTAVRPARDGQTPELAERFAIEGAVTKIRQSATVQMERLQILLDGVTLGVEQVQDRRLHYLEQRLQESASDTFIGGIVALALDATPAGRLAGLTRTLLRGMLSSRMLVQLVPSTRNRANMAAFIRAVRADRQRWSLATVRQFRGLDGTDVNEFRRYTAALARGLQGSDTEKNAAAIAKRAWANRHKLVDEPPNVNATDSAGVGVLAAVQEYASSHRLAIALHRDAIEEIARLRLLNPQQLDTLGEAVEWETLDQTSRQAREHYKLLSEAAIWAALYNFDKAGKISVRGLSGVKEDLLGYWFQRFPTVIEEWTQGRPLSIDYLGRPVTIPPVSDFSQLTRIAKMGLVNQYFHSLALRLPVGTFVAPPPPPRR